MKSSFLPAHIFLILLLTFMVACRDSVGERSNVFRVNLSSGLTSLDPAFSKDQPSMWVCQQLYNGLVQVNHRLEIMPSIAKSWSVAENGLSITFYLRDDVYFHHHPDFPEGKGRRVVASDFVYSFNRIIDADVASTGAWLFNGKVQDIEPFKAINDTTFQIRLRIPFRPMLSLLSLPYCSVVPKELIEKYGKDFRKHAVGTGPFNLIKWEENVALVLGKHKAYFEKDSQGITLPYLDGVKFTFINDRAVEFLQLLQGQIDVVSGIDKSFRDKALLPNGELRPELKDLLIYERAPYLNTEYLGFSMKKQTCTAIADKRVRQAINYAIDRQKMLTFLRNGIGQPAHYGMIPPGLPGFDSIHTKGYSFHREKAVQLLAEAGYPEGRGLPPLVLHSNPQYQDLTDFIAKSLEEVGFKVQVQLSPGSLLRAAMSKNEVDFFRASWIGDYPDAENYLALFFSAYDAPPNYTFFKHQRYDELYKKAISSTDDQEVLSWYQEMDQLILDEAPVVPLFYDEIIRFKHQRVRHLSINPMNMLVLKDAVISR
jgi:oligopeptide transport system substrate-binding protein